MPNLLPFDELIKFETVPSIATDGIVAIRDILKSHTEITPRTAELIMLNSGSDWLTKEGKFPKRISKYTKKRGYDLPSDVVSEIGNIASNNLIKETTYWLDFTRDLDWDSGDFGDDGSCYYRDFRAAKDSLEDQGGFAIRMFHPSAPYPGKYYPDFGGLGRAWCLYDATDNIYVLYNGYSNSRYTSMQTRHFATVLSLFLDDLDKENKITKLAVSMFDDEGTQYVNGGSGYLIGKRENINVYDRYNLNFSVCEGRHYDRDVWRQCVDCGDRYNYYHESSSYTFVDNEGYKCWDCFYVGKFKCSHCHNWFDEETVVTTSFDQEYCQTCAEDHIYTCDCCHRICSDTTHHPYKFQDKIICRICNQHAPKCTLCGSRITNISNSKISSIGTCYCGRCSDNYNIEVIRYIRRMKNVQ